MIKRKTALKVTKRRMALTVTKKKIVLKLTKKRIVLDVKRTGATLKTTKEIVKKEVMKKSRVSN